MPVILSLFFFFNDTATTEIYTLSLHDALPISHDFYEILCKTKELIAAKYLAISPVPHVPWGTGEIAKYLADRKSTRLNSSHLGISYAVFCLKKKNDAT